MWGRGLLVPLKCERAILTALLLQLDGPMKETEARDFFAGGGGLSLACMNKTRTSKELLLTFSFFRTLSILA